MLASEGIHSVEGWNGYVAAEPADGKRFHLLPHRWDVVLVLLHGCQDGVGPYRRDFHHVLPCHACHDHWLGQCRYALVSVMGRWVAAVWVGILKNSRFLEDICNVIRKQYGLDSVKENIYLPEIVGLIPLLPLFFGFRFRFCIPSFFMLIGRFVL